MLYRNQSEVRLCLKPKLFTIMPEVSADTYWESRYRQSDFPWDLGHASRPLVDWLSQHARPDLRILIPGGGLGWELEWLWQKGFRALTQIDIAHYTAEAIVRRNPLLAPHLRTGDFFELEGAFDLIIEQTFFCALNPAQRPDYARHMAQLLAPGGLLAGVWFCFPLTEQGPPFGGSPEEYLGLLKPYFESVVWQPCTNSEPSREGKEIWLEVRKKS